MPGPVACGHLTLTFLPNDSWNPSFRAFSRVKYYTEGFIECIRDATLEYIKIKRAGHRQAEMI